MCLLVATSSCSDRGSDSRTVTQQSNGVQLRAAPSELIQQCRHLRIVRRACPTEVPAVGGKVYTAQAFRHGSYAAFSMAAGTEYPEAEKNRPPRFSHVVAEGGDLRRGAFAPFTNIPSRRTPPRNGLVSTNRARPALIGRPIWNEHRGLLVLMPGFEARDSLDADHLVFLWEESGNDYALSLHAWEPLSEVISTLRALVTATE